MRPVGADEAVVGLFRAARAGRLPHALVFEGPDGIGKFLAARWLAQGLLCERGPLGPGGTEEPCGACGPCRRFLAGSHPDLHVVDPRAEGEDVLKIDRIVPRDTGTQPSVEELLALSAGEGGWRVVVIRDFDLANESAQNALLKKLEEPRPSTLLVLVTSRPDRLLPTVRSRCVRVRFAPLGREECARVLVEAGDVSEEEAARLARWSRGAPGLALALRGTGAAELRATLGAVLAGSLDPLGAARALAEAPGSFPGQTPAARARSRARWTLALAVELLRTLVEARAGLEPAELAHGDWLEEQDPAALAAWGPDTLEEALECLLRARLDVEANLQAEGALDRALLGVARARACGGRPPVPSR